MRCRGKKQLDASGTQVPRASAVSLEEPLHGLQPPNVLALLLVERRGIDEVAHLVVHAHLGEVLVEGLLELIVDILELRPVVTADALLLLGTCERLDVADHVAVVLARLRAAIERDPRAGLFLHGHAEVGGLLLASFAAFLFLVRVEWARELPLNGITLSPTSRSSMMLTSPSVSTILKSDFFKNALISLACSYCSSSCLISACSVLTTLLAAALLKPRAARGHAGAVRCKPKALPGARREARPWRVATGRTRRGSANIALRGAGARRRAGGPDQKK